MQTPVEIDFQGMKGSEKLRTSIINHVDGLEERFGRITACRVAVKGPSEHHRKGTPYEISIRLLLPQGREIDIARTSFADERLADIDFAINDAFKRARRRLSDQARLIRGHVKSHNGQPIATVRRVDREAGFGFLETAARSISTATASSTTHLRTLRPARGWPFARRRERRARRPAPSSCSASTLCGRPAGYRRILAATLRLRNPTVRPN